MYAYIEVEIDSFISGHTWNSVQSPLEYQPIKLPRDSNLADTERPRIIGRQYRPILSCANLTFWKYCRFCL